jgi:hypothetical protein
VGARVVMKNVGSLHEVIHPFYIARAQIWKSDLLLLPIAFSQIS